MTQQRLVVSGCSYMEYYASGQGHADLAARLNIPEYQSYAESGSCNDRIIRSVLRDCFQTTLPTLYVVGLTFLHRFEIPLLETPGSDGRWESCTGQPIDQPSCNWRSDIDLKEYNTYCALRAHMFYLDQSLEKTMYWVLSAIRAVKSLGHRIVIFNTAETGIKDFLDQPRFQLLNTTEIVGGYRWCSIKYQIDQGAQWCSHDSKLDLYVRHIESGQHRWLNDFLTNYIQEYKILQ